VTPRALSPVEVRYQRLELAEDMLELVLHDTPPLPDRLQQTLQSISAVLGEVREQTRRLS
jgi:hypothetical protein